MDWRAGCAWCNNMRIHCLVLSILAVSGSAFAQPGRAFRGPMGPGDFAFIRGEFGIANKVVQGAPYTAQAVTQFTRTLADGNRIQRTTTTSVARDSEGRTRTELSLDTIGPLAATRSSDALRRVFISDTVAGVSYVLNPNNRTFRRMPIRSRKSANGRTPQETPLTRPSGRPGSNAVKSEDLGTQTLQGVTVQGKRVTRTIPAAQAGNQLPIDLVTETWFSTDLQAVIMSKASDPRFGETVYQLTNISRAEPDHALFVTPSDYTEREAGLPKGSTR